MPVTTTARLIESREDVLNVLSPWSSAMGEVPSTEEELANEVRDSIQRVRKALITGKLDQINWTAGFNGLGPYLLKMVLVRRGAFDGNEFADMLLDKHARYGAKPLTEWGPLGVVIRMSSKFERYENLVANPSIPHGDESLCDTLRDMLGYCVLAYRMVSQPKDGGK